MARPLSILLLSTAVVLASSPVMAQFGSIFGGDQPPRPPASVPGRPSAPPPMQRQAPVEQQAYPQNGYPQGSPQNIYPDRLPPGPPPNARIQSQPLPPPPGADTAPADSRPQGQPVPTAQTPVQPLPGLAPGQRQPRGTPASTAPQPGDEVVTEPPAQKIVNPTAVFSGLDKITGRITTFEVAINETVRFGALEVTPRACYTRPPTENANTDGFIEIDEVTLQGELRRIFTGWMYAASPGLNAVEHPIYDVWLTDCKGATPPAVTAEAPAEPPPAPRRAAPQPRRAAPPQQLPPPPAPLR